MFNLTDLRTKSEKRSEELASDAKQYEGFVESALLDAHGLGHDSTRIGFPQGISLQNCATLARDIRSAGMRAEVELLGHDKNSVPRYGIQVHGVRVLEGTPTPKQIEHRGIRSGPHRFAKGTL